MSAQIEIPAKAVAEFCMRNHIRRLAIFGSVIRDDFRPESDVDFLVEFEPEVRVGLIGLAGMEIELGQILKRKADLRTVEDLSPYFREDVLKSAELLYEQT